jgi:hypothetical protein
LVWLGETRLAIFDALCKRYTLFYILLGAGAIPPVWAPMSGMPAIGTTPPAVGGSLPALNQIVPPTTGKNYCLCFVFFND